MSNDDLFLVQYGTPGPAGLPGLQQGNRVSTLSEPVDSLDWLLSAEGPRAAELIDTLLDAAQTSVEGSLVTLHAPVSSQEIWAAGVTYKRSEEARERESNNSN